MCFVYGTEEIREHFGSVFVSRQDLLSFPSRTFSKMKNTYQCFIDYSKMQASKVGRGVCIATFKQWDHIEVSSKYLIL